MCTLFNFYFSFQLQIVWPTYWHWDKDFQAQDGNVSTQLNFLSLDEVSFCKCSLLSFVEGRGRQQGVPHGKEISPGSMSSAWVIRLLVVLTCVVCVSPQHLDFPLLQELSWCRQLEVSVDPAFPVWSCVENIPRVLSVIFAVSDCKWLAEGQPHDLTCLRRCHPDPSSFALSLSKRSGTSSLFNLPFFS